MKRALFILAFFAFIAAVGWGLRVALLSPPATIAETPSAAPAPAPPSPSPAASSAAPPDYMTAKREVEATLKANPKDYALRIRAAEFYMRAGDHPAAIPHLQAATKLMPKEILPWIALGDAATLSGRLSLAKQAYDRADRIQPGNPFVIRGRGQLLVMQKKFHEARAVLEKGLKQHPEDAEIQTALGNLYLVLNKPSLAMGVLEPAVKRYPERADLRFLLAEAYERDLKVETAIRELKEAVRLDPNMAEAWGRMGLYLINLTRYAEARPPLEKAITLNPGEPHYYWALGDSYLLDTSNPDNFHRAAQLYRKALSINPNNQKALYSFGMALTRHGQKADLEEAAKLFRRLVKLNPNDMNAHYKLYETYQRLGRPKEAQKYRDLFFSMYQKGRQQTREREQGASFVDTAAAHVKLARDAMTKRDFTLAVKEFELALERDPNLAEARQGLIEARKRLSGERKAGSE